MARLEPFEDRGRVGDDLAVLRDEEGDEPLPAHRLDRRAVVRVDVDPLDIEALVPDRERDALDVRREGDPVDAHVFDRSEAGGKPLAEATTFSG